MDGSRQHLTESESSSTESDSHLESIRIMDFEDSQDSISTNQSTSNTTIDSHRQNPELEIDSGNIVPIVI